MIDTGANRTTVPAKLIQTHQYTGRTAKAILANRGIDNLKTAMVDLQVDGITKKSMVVFVIDGDANHILLGRDHPSVKAWIYSEPAAEAVDVPITLDAITRAQNQVLENEEVANQLADIRDGAEIKQLLSPKLKSKRKEAQKPNLFVHDHETQFTNLEVGLTKLADKGSSSTIPPAEERVRGQNTRAVTEEGYMREDEEYMKDDEIEEDTSGLGEADFLNRLETGVHSDQALPILCKGKEGVDELITQQKADSTLAEMRRKAEKREDGYLWEDGVLVHVKLVDPGREWTRVVVPYCRCREVIDVGHRGLVGGHFSHNKMVASITQHFTWPGLRKDVKAFCSACLEYQKAGRWLKPKAPLMVTPIISVPYQRLACDLVGPLNRSKSAFRYILTIMCLGTRYPYAIPLKKVDAIIVAEGIMEVVAPTGIPMELLSDQGSIFIGKVNNELCRLLNIEKLKTTAYHP